MQFNSILITNFHNWDFMNPSCGFIFSQFITFTFSIQVRVETGGPLAYVAIAGNCAGAVSVGDCVAAMLLQVDPHFFTLTTFTF